MHGSFFTTKEIALEPGEIDTIKLFVATGKYSTRFKLAVDYVVGTDQEKKAHSVDNGGRYFALSAYSCDPSGLPSYQRLYALATPTDPQFRLRRVKPTDMSDSLWTFDFEHLIAQLVNG
ncbi:hypothetical protein [Nonomuraea sediminis]|uniref:hypothetical protein n=1 Tax=Nonomuraea sediminis TaxID=2835864 RepID=UPI001BDBC0E5|nr:hypothetical protein [Nonomuraea sediminis]